MSDTATTLGTNKRSRSEFVSRLDTKTNEIVASRNKILRKIKSV